MLSDICWTPVNAMCDVLGFAPRFARTIRLSGRDASGGYGHSPCEYTGGGSRRLEKDLEVGRGRALRTIPHGSPEKRTGGPD